MGAAQYLIDQLSASHGQATQFAAMGITNLASGAGAHREQLLREGVFAPLFNLLMSNDARRQKYSCMALANLAFSNDEGGHLKVQSINSTVY
jgi:hypothetical protein